MTTSGKLCFGLSACILCSALNLLSSVIRCEEGEEGRGQVGCLGLFCRLMLSGLCLRDCTCSLVPIYLHLQINLEFGHTYLLMVWLLITQSYQSNKQIVSEFRRQILKTDNTSDFKNVVLSSHRKCPLPS